MLDKRKQKTFERIRWKDLGKRLLVTGLTVAMIGNSVDLSALAVLAKADKGRTTVVSFEELSKDVAEQTLPLGGVGERDSVPGQPDCDGGEKRAG